MNSGIFFERPLMPGHMQMAECLVANEADLNATLLA